MYLASRPRRVYFRLSRRRKFWICFWASSGAAASATEMVITFDADGTVNANPATDSTIVVTPCTAGGGGNSEASGS